MLYWNTKKTKTKNKKSKRKKGKKKKKRKEKKKKREEINKETKTTTTTKKNKTKCSGMWDKTEWHVICIVGRGKVRRRIQVRHVIIRVRFKIK